MQAVKRKKTDGSWAVDLPGIDDAFVSFDAKTEGGADLLCEALTDHAADAYVIPTTTTKTAIGPRGRVK
jgi:hypothetical protein